MWKFGKVVGHVPKVLNAIKKAPEVATAVTQHNSTTTATVPSTPPASLQPSVDAVSTDMLTTSSSPSTNNNMSFTSTLQSYNSANSIQSKAVKLQNASATSSSTESVSTDTSSSQQKPVLVNEDLSQEEDMFKIPEEPFKDQITGISSITVQELAKLLKEPLYRKKFAQIFFFEQAKIAYYLFKTPLSEQMLLGTIAKCFSIYTDVGLLRRDLEAFEIFTKKHGRTCQQILTLLFPKKFSVQLLKEQWGHLIDLSYLKNISMGTLIEFYVFREILDCCKIDPKDFLGHLRAIDPQSPLLDSADLYKPTECESQISQKFSDLFIYFLRYESNAIKAIKVYRDVKMDYKGPSTGHFTIIPYLTTDIIIAKNYMLNAITFLKNKLKQTISHKNLITDYLKNLEELRISIKNTNIKETIDNFNENLMNMTINASLIVEGINMTIAIDCEHREDIDVGIILDNIQKDSEISELFQEKILYPNTNKISGIMWKEQYEIMIKVINRYIPESYKESVLSNYKQAYQTIYNEFNIDHK